MFARRHARQGFLVVLLAILTACASPPPESNFPEITFEDRPQIRLDVASVDIETAYG